MRLNYDELSPITGTMSVLVEHEDGVTMKMCMESGYQTYNSWKIGSEELTAFESSSPDIILDSKFVDEKKGQVWYKTAIFSKGFVLYPDGELWKVGKFKEFVEGETVRFEWATMKKEDQLFVLDDKNAKIFTDNEFIEAYVEFNNSIAQA